MTIPAKIGRYDVTRLLGKGGMGKVYLARDPFFDRDVALKTIRLDSPSFAGRADEARARFLKEAKITGRLQHPHIVVVYEFGEEETLLFLAMEYISGGNLFDLLEKDAAEVPLPSRLLLAAEVAEALAYAHDRGVLHRDIKPANILLTTQGHAKVADFGIGKLLEGDVNLTRTGEMIGSPAFMSPEQMRGEKLDQRSDIFSFGGVLYQMLTGQKPFPAETLTSLVVQVLNSDPPDPLSLNPELPPGAVSVLRRCLAKDKDARYPDCGDLARELRALTPTLVAPSIPGARAVGREAVADEDDQPPGAGAETTGQIPTTRGPSQAFAIGSAVQPAATGDPGAATMGGAAAAAGSAAPRAVTASAKKKPPVALLAGAAALAIALGVVAVALRTRGPAQPPVAEPPPASTPVPGGMTEATGPVTAEAEVEVRVQAPTPAPASASALTPLTPTIRLEARRGVRLRIKPEQARVFLDDRCVGIAADWSDRNGGSILYFVLPGEHRLRIAYPGHEDLIAHLQLRREASQEVADLLYELKGGTPRGPTGPEGTLPPAQYKTVRAVRFSVRPPTALVTIDGKPYGTAGEWESKDLDLNDVGVYEVSLSAEGKTKTVRVMVSLLSGQARATVKEKL